MDDNALHVGELVHDGVLYDYVNTCQDDLPFYLKWCRAAGGPVLECCCGTGRLTIPLREAGVDIVGLDCCDSMLARARHKAREHGIDLELVHADIRDFALPRKFSLIFVPFNSLQCMYSVADLEAVLANVRRHLAEGGWFVFDIFNPSIDFMVERSAKQTEIRDFHTDDGRHVRIAEQCRYDDARQVNRVQWTFTIDGRVHVQNLDIRCFYPLEMDALLRHNSMRVVHKLGAFDETPFQNGSPKQIYVCQVGE